MYQPRPSHVALPPTISVDLSHLVAGALTAPASAAERAA